MNVMHSRIASCFADKQLLAVPNACKFFSNSRIFKLRFLTVFSGVLLAMTMSFLIVFRGLDA